MSSIVATTLKIALHRWINYRVCHENDEITGSVASCAVSCPQDHYILPNMVKTLPQNLVQLLCSFKLKD